MKDLPGLFAHGPDLIVEKNLTVSGRVHLLGGKGDLFTWMDGVETTLAVLQVVNRFAGAEALWVAKGAGTADNALIDLSGNGNHLDYDDYDEGEWRNEYGWAGDGSSVFDTGIIPALEQTVYVAFANVVNPANNAGLIGCREDIGGTIYNHHIRVYVAATDDHRCAFEGTSDGETPRVESGVLAMNKNGFWLNGVEFSAQSITDDRAYSLTMYLMSTRDPSGTAGDVLNDGYVAAAAIVGETDDDEMVYLRSRALMNLIGIVE